MKEDKDIVKLIDYYRPSYLRYIDKAKSVKNYIEWDNSRFANNLTDFLREHDIEVTPDGYDYVFRTCERFRRRIYGP